MKKIDLKSMVIGFAIAIIGTTTVFTVSAASSIRSASFTTTRVYFNGDEVPLENPLVSIIAEGETNARLYMPLRELLEYMNFVVEWDGDNNTVNLVYGEQVVDPHTANAHFIIAEDFDLHIPFIEAGEIILLGQVNLEPGQMLEVSIEVEEGRGFFIGRGNSPNIDNVLRGAWTPFHASSATDHRLLSVEFAQSGGTYLYVGSTYPMNPTATDLSDVTVRVRVRSE